MKMKTMILIMLVMISILPYTAAATPGIYVTIDPLSQPAVSGNTIDYGVIVSNMDDGIPKLITSLDIISAQPGWTYAFNPDIVGQEIPGVKDAGINTILSVTSPAGMARGIYGHQINAEVEYTLMLSDPLMAFIPSIPLTLTEFDPENFNTEIQDSASIPEFPTIALPVLSVIGLLFVFERRRDN